MSIFAGKDPIWTARRGSVSAGLVGHWDSMAMSAADRMGNILYDISGNNNHGTLINGASFENRGIRFDGIDDFVSLSALTVSLNSFTVSAWFRTTSSGDEKIFSLDNINHLIQIAGGQIRICTGVSGENQCGAGGSSITDNVWRLATTVGDTTSIRVYVNNTVTPIITNTARNNVVNSVSPRIGRVGTTGGSTYCFNGSIEQVSLYNRPLSVSEIARNFNATRARFGV